MASYSSSNTLAVPSNTGVVDAGRLDHRPVGCERSLEHQQPAGGVDRRGHGVQDLSVRMPAGREPVEVLGQRPTGHRHDVAVQQPRVEQLAHDHRHAADPVDVVHDVATERLDVGEVRRAVADPVEVVDRQVDLGLAGDGEQVQHRVRGAAERHDDGDGVLERLLGS